MAETKEEIRARQEASYKRFLRQQMKPGDYLMADPSAEGGWAIVRNVPDRDTEQSVLGAVGRFADKYLGFGNDRRRSRLISGVASQWYGLDEGGNPAYGETPGIVYETKALGMLPTTLGRAGMDWYFRNLGEKIGTGDLTQDPMYQMVQKAMLSDPEWAVEAAEKADAIHKAVRQDMGLKAPQGFEENAQESLGVMLGQLPVPGKLATKGVEAAAAAPSALKRVAQGAEWFTPTVRPSVGNYATGTGVGATLGTLAEGGEEEEIPTILPDPKQKGLYHVRPVYSDGSTGFSGHPDDEAALKILLAEQVEREEGYAGGGKVTAAEKLIEKYLKRMSPSKWGTRNTPQYVETVRRLMPPESVPTRKEDWEIIDSYIGEPNWQARGVRHPIDGVVERLAFDLPPDVPLFRGVGAENEDFTPVAFNLTPGAKLNLSPRQTVSSSQSRREAEGFATGEGNGSDWQYLFNLHRKEPVRAFPLVGSSESEWLLNPKGLARVKRVLNPDVKEGGPKGPYWDVDVDYTQMKKFDKGGSVKDYCSGGMAAVKSMKAKYAEGGKVNSALKAIKDAIAHLDNNDTASALRTLNANPDALRDPGIAEALRKLRHPTTAKQGRRALDSAAAADTERAKISTFAKGGKVNNARRTAAAVLRYMRSIDSNMSYDAYDDLDKLAKRAKKSPAQLDSILQETYGNLTRDASKSEIRSEVKKVVERGVGPNPSFGRGAGRMKPQGSTKKD